MTARIAKILLLSGLVIASAFGRVAHAVPIVAYFNDFDSNPTLATGVSAILSGVTHTESVQGYAGIGTPGNVFASNFLRHIEPSSQTTLTLTDLPTHSSISLGFLLAIIDTWDGNSHPGNQGPDFFTVQVDGSNIFSESFDNTPEINPNFDPSYIPPAGVELTWGVAELGFMTQICFGAQCFTLVPGVGNVADAAYAMGIDPIFQNIAHTASTLTIDLITFRSWFPVGQNDPSHDESLGIENLSVTLNLDTPQSVPEPTTLALLAFGLAGIACARRRRGQQL